MRIGMVWLGILAACGIWKYGDAVLCEIGEALKDPNNPSIDRTCQEGVVGQCPGDYVCTARPAVPGQFASAVCCPSKAQSCNLPQSIGSSCGASMPSQRYSFSPNEGSCTMFTYNGCFGNYNNFYSKEECERSCLSSLCPRGIPARSSFGQLQRCVPFSTSTCPVNFECKQTSGGSSLGAVCCPSQSSVCSQPMQSGTSCSFGSQPVQRYYYESTSRMCQMFQFMGCFGNDNNFGTVQECQQFCSGSGPSTQICPAGTTPAPGTTTSTPCSQFGNNCPQGYTCQFSPVLGQRYCCSGGGGGVSFCPAGTFPPVGGAMPPQCNPAFPSCQAGYFCQQSQLDRQFYCCSTSGGGGGGGNMCPGGSTMAPGGATTCSETNPCSQGYACEISNVNSQFYCCSARDPFGQLCSIGTNPAPGVSVQTPCTQGAAPCPNGYACRQASNGQSYCCSSSGQSQSQFCPAGSTPAPGVTAANTCAPWLGAGACQQTGYSCQQSPSTQQFYCCSAGGGGGGGTSQLCPIGTQPAPGITSSTPCNPALMCQPGYSCQRSPFNGQNYCCTIGGGGGAQFCPAGTSPAPGVSVNTPCTPGIQCPQQGYFCQQSSTSAQSYCCSSGGGSTTQLCPSGWTASSEANVNNPCNPFTTCRTGYTCQRSPANGQSYCCAFAGGGGGGGGGSNLCPVGSAPAPNVNMNTPCDQSASSCPFGYTCQYSPSNGMSYCCSATSGGSQLCPFGSNPPPGTTAANVCNQFSPCPGGYSCQPSPFTGQMYCCSGGGGGTGAGLCPVGSNPAPGVTQGTTCFNDATCPFGYTCQRNVQTGFQYCCSQSGGGGGGSQQCPQGGTPQLQPGTNQPVACMMGGAQCQQPYQCQAQIGSAFGTCCGMGGGGGGQDCPQGFSPYRPNGLVVNCGFGGSIQQQICQPFAQCMMSPGRGSFICCTSFARAAKEGVPMPCNSTADCSSVKNANCIDYFCQCPSGYQPTFGEKCSEFSGVTNGTVEYARKIRSSKKDRD